ncbi:MAG TPA: hypothetical protein VF573_19215 [Paraburkholderia sp.]|uniref:hypothetical protein n=1 Tax=Paraburkholderia sp. TaxID=1926495 RepID=UPI002ED39D5E
MTRCDSHDRLASYFTAMARNNARQRVVESAAMARIATALGTTRTRTHASGAERGTA